VSTGDVQAFYGQWARAYDWLCRLLPGVQRLRRAAVAALEIDAGDTVVDLGCGTGANLALLRERVGPDGAVVGVDLTRGMLGVAARRVERHGWENVHLVRGDAARPPVDGVDAVLGSFVVGLLADPGAAVERWVDRVVPGGRVAVLEAGRSRHPHARHLNWAFDEFVAAGAPSGGRDAPSRTLDDRIEAARDALTENATLTRDERRAAGFVRVFAADV